MARIPLRAAAATTVAAAAALVSSVVALAPATAAGPSYVALGDSYSSGTGTRSYISDGTSCQRSTLAYPSLIATARGYSLNFRACSGARIPDVTTSQLGALSASTSYVTISVGGNDAGFADVLTECAQPGWMSDCNAAINTAQSFITSTLPGRLSTLYGSIRSRAPYAKIVVVGYPRVFMGEDCNAFTWFSPEEQSRLNYTADLLNSRISAQAAAKGFTFSNPTSRFTGHAVCDDVEWINGLSNPVSESYHPNRAGHSSGYTPLVSPVLTGATVTTSAALVAAAEGQSDEIAASQRRYAATDRAIKPAVVRRPDLTTPEARRAAAAAGVDLGDRASIDRADAAYSKAQYDAWLASQR